MREIFKLNAFLTKKKATRSSSFIYKLAETAMFANFIENQFLGGPDKQELLHFSKLMTQERTKTSATVIGPFVPSKVTRAYPPNSQGVPPASSFSASLETYQYKVFPRLSSKEFIKGRLMDLFVEEDAPVQTFKRDDEVVWQLRSRS